MHQTNCKILVIFVIRKLRNLYENEVSWSYIKENILKHHTGPELLKQCTFQRFGI